MEAEQKDLDMFGCTMECDLWLFEVFFLAS